MSAGGIADRITLLRDCAKRNAEFDVARLNNLLNRTIRDYVRVVSTGLLPGRRGIPMGDAGRKSLLNIDRQHGFSLQERL